jgi:hypothetical protein
MFGRRKAINDNFCESVLMAWKGRSKGVYPRGTAFFFYRIFPEKSTGWHYYCPI